MKHLCEDFLLNFGHEALRLLSCLCPYCQTVTLTGASHIASKEINFSLPLWKALSGKIDTDVEVMNASKQFWILTQCT
jgi:hypothetical protein